MLDRLLSMLATGGVHTPAELASRLGVSQRLVEQMLADLSQMGYLRPLSDPACQTLSCAECPTAEACAVWGAGGRVWVLTDKQANASRKASDG